MEIVNPTGDWIIVNELTTVQEYFTKSDNEGVPLLLGYEKTGDYERLGYSVISYLHNGYVPKNIARNKIMYLVCCNPTDEKGDFYKWCQDVFGSGSEKNGKTSFILHWKEKGFDTVEQMQETLLVKTKDDLNVLKENRKKVNYIENAKDQVLWYYCDKYGIQNYVPECTKDVYCLTVAREIYPYCDYDVDHFSDILRLSGIKSENIVKLANDEATYQNVVKHMEEGIQHDFFIFHYTGHGNTEENKNEYYGHQYLKSLLDEGTTKEKWLYDVDICDIFKKSNGYIFAMFACCRAGGMIDDMLTTSTVGTFSSDGFSKKFLSNMLGGMSEQSDKGDGETHTKGIVAWCACSKGGSSLATANSQAGHEMFVDFQTYNLSLSSYAELWTWVGHKGYRKVQCITPKGNKEIISYEPYWVEPECQTYGQEFTNDRIFDCSYVSDGDYPEDDLESEAKKLDFTLISEDDSVSFCGFHGWNDYKEYDKKPSDTLFRDNKSSVELCHGPMVTFHVPYVTNTTIGHFLGEDGRGIGTEGLGSERILEWMKGIGTEELGLKSRHPQGMFVWYCSSQYQAAKECYKFQKKLGAEWDADSPKYTIYGFFEDGTTYSRVYSLSDEDTMQVEGSARFVWQDKIVANLKEYYLEYDKHRIMHQHARTITQTADAFDPSNVLNSSGVFNYGDQTRNLTAEIGVWNGNLPLVMEQADLCCIPVLIMKGVSNFGNHYAHLSSQGFRNWQTSCSMYLSYEHCGWGEGYSEQWIEENTSQANSNGVFLCPEIAIHWKDSDGNVLNVGRYFDADGENPTEIGYEPIVIEQILSDYFLELEEIDMDRCGIGTDGDVSFGKMGSDEIIDNKSQVKNDYNMGGIYQNPDNLIAYSDSLGGVPIVCFYDNGSVEHREFTEYFQNLNLTGVDYWKNNEAGILWGYVDSDKSKNTYEKASVGGYWHTWIGDLDNNEEWIDQPFLLKIYDPTRGVDESMSFDQVRSLIESDSDHSGNFTGIFTTLLSSYYSENSKKGVYSVTFLDYDGSQLGDTQEVAYGEDAVATTPTRSGYVFTKFEPDYNCVTTDLVCVAQYAQSTSEDDDQESDQNGEIFRIVRASEFGRYGTSFSYADTNSHTLRISNNVIGEVLASKNENGLKSQLTKVVYTSQNVIELSAYCFHGCKMLQDLDLLSTNITQMGEGCLEGCSSLTSVNLPEKLEYLSPRIFANCQKLKDITLGFSEFGDISQNALIGSSIESIFLRNMVSSDIYQYCSMMMIRFQRNSPLATGEMDDIRLECGETWVCPECAYSRQGYEFSNRWTTNQDGSGDAYVPGKEYAFVNGYLVLYAQWKL